MHVINEIILIEAEKECVCSITTLFACKFQKTSDMENLVKFLTLTNAIYHNGYSKIILTEDNVSMRFESGGHIPGSIPQLLEPLNWTFTWHRQISKTKC